MTLQRILTAAILIPLVVFAVLRAPTWLIALLVTVVMLLALREFFDLAARAGAPGHPLWTAFFVALVMGHQALSFPSPQIPGSLFRANYAIDSRHGLAALALVYFLGLALLTLCGERPIIERFHAVGTSLAGLFFVAFPLIFIDAIHSDYLVGPQLLFFLLVLIWVGDTLAYFVGRQFGRHPMAAQLSPGKTWEGAVANLAGSLLVALAFSHWTGFQFMFLAPAAVLGNVAGQIGDLMESVYKRAAGAKDSSALLPGHGGILDRIDSLIFAAPVVWYYFSVTPYILVPPHF
jgi:phosphatidate cytidylyltransferase